MILKQSNDKPQASSSSELPLPDSQPRDATDTPAAGSADQSSIVPLALADLNAFHWDEDRATVENYVALGERLSQTGELFRKEGHEGGLICIPKGNASHSFLVSTAGELGPVIIDRVRIVISKGGKVVGGLLPAKHLGLMLKCEAFLRGFRSLTRVSNAALVLPNFSCVETGYNDGGEGHRTFYTGSMCQSLSSGDAIPLFLDVMAFESNADRTNTVAAALTVLMRTHFVGGKPLIWVHATKSHAGKDTIIAFATGKSQQTSISYQAADWALERDFVGALDAHPDTGILVVENARLDTKANQIKSAYLERFITDPAPLLHGVGKRKAHQRRNDLVIGISTNFGDLSTDLMNRALPSNSRRGEMSPIACPALETRSTTICPSFATKSNENCSA